MTVASALPPSYFRLDGVPYVGIPSSPADIPDHLLPIWRALCRLIPHKGKPRTKASNRVLARLLDRSISTVKRWLAELVALGRIERPHDEQNCRTIWILLGIRSSRPKSKTGNAAGAKILGAPGPMDEPGGGSPVGHSLSFERATLEKQQAAVVDEGDGTPSPPAAEQPRTAADALAAMMAAAGAARAAQERSAPPRAVDSPPAPAVTPRAAVRLALVRDLEAFERMAAGGDRVAAGELPFVRARLEQFDVQSPPEVDPPGVGSAPIADPPA